MGLGQKHGRACTRGLAIIVVVATAAWLAPAHCALAAMHEPTVADYDDEPEGEVGSTGEPEPRSPSPRPRRWRLGVEARALAAAWAKAAHRSDASARELAARLPRLVLDVGWVFRDTIVVGAELGGAFESRTRGGEPISQSFAGVFVPYAQWMIPSERRARPYAQLRAGVGGAAWSSAPSGAAAGVAVHPIVGVGAGVNLRLHERFAIVFGSDLDYAAPFTRSSAAGGRWQWRGHLVALTILLGVSARF